MDRTAMTPRRIWTVALIAAAATLIFPPWSHVHDRIIAAGYGPLFLGPVIWSDFDIETESVRLDATRLLTQLGAIAAVAGVFQLVYQGKRTAIPHMSAESATPGACEPGPVSVPDHPIGSRMIGAEPTATAIMRGLRQDVQEAEVKQLPKMRLVDGKLVPISEPVPEGEETPIKAMLRREREATRAWAKEQAEGRAESTQQGAGPPPQPSSP